MIIPPDPEKDPRLFQDTASTSTPSLLPPPTESDADGDGDAGDLGNVRLNPSYGYPHSRNDGGNHGTMGLRDPFSDEYGEGDGDESLPPYSRRRSRELPRHAASPSPANFVPEMRERERDTRTRGVTMPLPHVVVPTIPIGVPGTSGIAPSPGGMALGMGMDGDSDLITPVSITPSARFSASTPGSSTAHLAGSTLVGSAGRAWEGEGSSYPASGPSSRTQANAIAVGRAKGKGKGKAKAKWILKRILPFSHPVDSDPSASPSTSTGRRRSSDLTAIPSHTATYGSSSSSPPTITPFSASEKPSAPPAAKWWTRTKYRRWLIGALVLALIVIGALIGLVVGFKQQGKSEEDAARARAFAQQNGPAWHDYDPQDGVRGIVWADGSMNLTWVEDRDAPPASDGNLTACNVFTPLNSSTFNFSSLYTPYPGNSLWSSTFLVPLKYFNSSSNATMYLPHGGDLPVAAQSHGSPLGSGSGSQPSASGSGSNESSHSASTATSGSESASASGSGSGAGAAAGATSGSSSGSGQAVPYNTSSSSADASAAVIEGVPASGSGSPAQTSAGAEAVLTAYGIYDEIPLFARGIASTGTVEIIGADADPEVIDGGVEGNIRIDVVVQYGGYQTVGDIVKVCQVVRDDGSVGVGIYTPIQTDGKITNPYMLDPTLLPSFHVVIRLPPSAVWERDPSLASSSSSSSSSGGSDDNDNGNGIPPPVRVRSMNMHVDAMALRVGDTRGLLDFGRFSFDAGRGGVAVDYIAARQVWIATSENSVRGTFNVSESLYVNSTDSSILANVILHDPNVESNTTITPTSWMQRRNPLPGPDEYQYASGNDAGDGEDGHGDGDVDWTASGANKTAKWYGASASSPADWTPSTSSSADWSSTAGSSSPSSSSSGGHCLHCSSGSSSSNSSSSSSGTHTADTLLSTITNATISNTVNTTFYTTDGLVSITYLAHPPRTALVSWIATNQGDMDISFHPNFVGPFAIRNAWGAIRLPRPRKRLWDDPLGLGRMRAVVEGVISVNNDTAVAAAYDRGQGADDDDDDDDDGDGPGALTQQQRKAAVDDYMFARAGLNETTLATSGTTVTGAAYWQAGANGTMSPKAVQSSSGRRGTAVVLGGWGDVTVGFDGR